MLVEPSGAPSPSRRASLALSRVRLERLTLADAALAAAAVLVVAGRGDLWVLAVLLGIADASAAAVLVTAAAGAIALDRFGSAALTDIAGAQAVLGAAGWHGHAGDLAATGLVALALVVTARRRPTAAVSGALAGALLAGPSVAAGFAPAVLHVVALAGGAAIGWFSWSFGPRRARAAAALGLAALATIVSVATTG